MIFTNDAMELSVQLLTQIRGEGASTLLFVPLALGLLVGGLAMFIFVRGVRRRGNPMGGARWRIAVLCGVGGLAAGYLPVHFAMKANPAWFGGSDPVVSGQVELQTGSSTVEVEGPVGSETGRDEKDSDQQVDTEDERRKRELRELLSTEEGREEHRRRVLESRREALDAIRNRRAEREEARLAMEAEQAEDRRHLESLDMEELEKVMEERRAELDRVTKAVSEPIEDPEEQAAMSERYFRAIRAHQAVMMAIVEKQRTDAGESRTTSPEGE